MTFREEIDGSDKTVEQDNNVSDGDEDVNRDIVQDSGGSDADKWEISRSDGQKKNSSLSRRRRRRLQMRKR